jgi:hypothetical protein
VRFDRTNTVAGLTGSTVPDATFDHSAITAHIGYFQRTGFFPPPTGNDRDIRPRPTPSGSP